MRPVKYSAALLEKVFADYATARFATNKELAESHGISYATLKRIISRDGWKERAGRLHTEALVPVPQQAPSVEVVAEVEERRPAGDVVALRRLRKQQQLSEEVDDVLQDEVHQFVSELPTQRGLPPQVRLGLLEGAARLRTSVFPGQAQTGESRQIAILIGFAP